MLKYFVFNLSLFFILFLIGCTPDVSDSDEKFLVNTKDYIASNLKGVKDDISKNIPLSKLIDDKVNPYMHSWDSIEITPLEINEGDLIGYIYFGIYSNIDCEAYLYLYIEQEVVEYEIVEEKVTDPTTGIVTVIEKKIEVDRYIENIDLTDGGELIKLSSKEDIPVLYELNYTVKDTSSSDTFKIILKDENSNKVIYEWGIDSLEFLIISSEENQE